MSCIKAVDPCCREWHAQVPRPVNRNVGSKVDYKQVMQLETSGAREQALAIMRGWWAMDQKDFYYVRFLLRGGER